MESLRRGQDMFLLGHWGEWGTREIGNPGNPEVTSGVSSDEAVDLGI